MELRGTRVLITGGAGYLGSHLAEACVAEGAVVRLFDNLTAGRRGNVATLLEGGKAELVEGDLLTADLAEALADVDAVFHLAANPDVRVGAEDARVHFEQNVLATHRLLEAMGRVGVDRILFTSTSTVYGEATALPTPETYGPLEPISLYGASKLACEAMLSAFAHTYGWRAVAFRFANVVGGRANHGVVVDFVGKLRANPRELEILGREPGTEKSYVYVDDCVAGLLSGWRSAEAPFEAYNLGSEDAISVAAIADVVCEEMGLQDVRYRWTGGVDEGRGWKGDVRRMHLAIDKLKATGWRPTMSSEEAVRQAVRDLLAE
jgi:UDP-glucose 4-epimerase